MLYSRMSDDGDGNMNPPLKSESIARIFELARKNCTADQWGEWLRVPFELAGLEGDQELALELSMAGAVGDPFEAAIRGGQHDFLDSQLTTPRSGYLQLAVELHRESIVSLLLDLGAEADPLVFDDKETLTPLLHASRAGNAGIVRLLLDAGASAHRRIRKDGDGDEDDEWSEEETESALEETESALDLAAIGGHVDLITEILQREPLCVHSVSPSTGFTALHHAAKHSQIGAIDALVEAGADLDAQDDAVGSGTALHAAVGSRDCEATLLALLRHGARVDPTEKRIMTPLCLAAEADNRVAADTLLSAGAKATIPLLVASGRASSTDMIPALLGCGAEVNTRLVSDGNTPLHMAARRALALNVKLLLKAGADETAVNDAGKIPLDVVGEGLSIFSRLFNDETESVHTLLVNAPSDRAWSRRGFFVLCRAFPERVRLHLTPPPDDRANDSCTTAPSANDVPSVDRAKTKRAATAQGRGGEGGQPAGAHTQESAAAFGAAMGRLMALEADVVFRKIMAYV